MELNKTNKIYIFIFSLLVTVTGISQANIKKSHYSLRKLKNEIGLQDKEIRVISRKIKNLEKNLENKNKEMLNVIKHKDDVNDLLTKLSIKQQNEIIKLNEIKLKLKKNYIGVVLNSLDHEERASNLMSKKVLLSSIESKMLEYRKTEKMMYRSRIRTQRLKDKFIEYIKTEKLLSDLLNVLENEKNRVVKKYLYEKDKKTKIRGRYQSIKRSFLLNEKRKNKSKKISRKDFISPLELFNNIEFKKKGITFEFKKQTPVLSTHSGRIVHVGSLSKYGNVVMIDHGKDLRSIILGEFNPKLKKGKKVQKGEIIGYTLDQSKKSLKSGKIYFEIRKRNKVQNTILYMDKKTLALNRRIGKKLL